MDKQFIKLAKSGDINGIKYCLDNGTIDCAFELQTASKNGHLEVVKLLLSYGTDIHADNDRALQWATYNGNTKVVKLLLDHGADLHVNHDWPLCCAMTNGHTKIAKILLDNGCKFGISALRQKRSVDNCCKN